DFAEFKELPRLEGVAFGEMGDDGGGAVTGGIASIVVLHACEGVLGHKAQRGRGEIGIFRREGPLRAAGFLGDYGCGGVVAGEYVGEAARAGAVPPAGVGGGEGDLCNEEADADGALTFDGGMPVEPALLQAHTPTHAEGEPGEECLGAG